MSALIWKKSSHSANNGACIEVAHTVVDEARWRKSSRSARNGVCVEVAVAETVVGARDSKEPGGPELWFRGVRWGGFVAAVKAGRFDLPA